MYCIYGLFRPSLALELGINKLKEKGFAGEKLAVIVLDPLTTGKQTLLDSMYSADGMSLVDGIALAASIGMVFGVIYGSVVYIGPIALGLIGMVVGGGVGYLLDRMIHKKKKREHNAPSGEIIVAVSCRSEEEATQAQSVMKEHQAVALGQLSTLI